MTDGPSLAERVHAALRRADATLATAESLTGGLVGAALTDVAGSSATYRGGVVAYATALKAALLGVPADLLAAHGPVHPATAAAMALGVAERLEATYGVATTGVAGPDAQDGHRPGEVYVAVAGPAGTTVRPLQVAGTRADVRREAVRAALGLTLEVVTAAGNPAG